MIILLTVWRLQSPVKSNLRRILLGFTRFGFDVWSWNRRLLYSSNSRTRIDLPSCINPFCRIFSRKFRIAALLQSWFENSVVLLPLVEYASSSFPSYSASPSTQDLLEPQEYTSSSSSRSPYRSSSTLRFLRFKHFFRPALNLRQQLD